MLSDVSNAWVTPTKLTSYLSKTSMSLTKSRSDRARPQAGARLGNPRPASVGMPGSRPGALRPCARQQAPRLRPGAAASLRPALAPGVKRRVVILQRKTGRPVQFEVTEQARRSIAAWLEYKGLAHDDWLFPSRMKRSCHLSTRQYARLVEKWVSLLRLGSGRIRHAQLAPH